MANENESNETFPPTHADDSTEAMPSEIVGQHIGPYKLLQVLGEGGMARFTLRNRPLPSSAKLP